MKALGFFSILFAFALSAIDSVAQVGRTPSGVERKANTRQPQSSPTPEQGDDAEIIKVNTQLVSIPVRVMDKTGRFIGGLSKANFKVIEDGGEQEVAMFSNEHEPFTVALVLDMSYSTKFKISEIQTAAIAFINQLRPQDRVMVVSFDQDVHLLCEPTNDRNLIYRAIKSTKITTGTSLYEAVDLVMNKRMRALDGRKAIILFTDGVDTTSRLVGDYNNLSDAMELDSLIYPIRYDTFADVQKMKNGRNIAGPQPITVSAPGREGEPLPFPIPGVGKPGVQGTTPEEYSKAGEYLEKLSVRTGGRLYHADTLGNLAAAYSKIAAELREFYSIGYYPSADRVAGKRASVRVKVNKEGLVVRSRSSFIIKKDKK